MRLVRQCGVVICALLLATPGLASELAVLRNGFSIPHARHRVIGLLTRLYTTADGKNYVDVPTAEIERFEEAELPPAVAPAPATPAVATIAPQPAPVLSLDEVVKQASEKHQLDADFISSVIHAESGFNARAVSPKGAQGLMQLMPDTASQLGVRNVFDPQANVEGGTRYLRGLLERYHFDVPKALAAYNAGPHRVEKYKGIPPYYETQAYIARIIKEYNRKKLAEQKAARKAKSRYLKSSARDAKTARTRSADSKIDTAAP